MEKKSQWYKKFKKKNWGSEFHLSGYKVGEKQMVSGWASNTCKHLQIENMKTDTVHLWDVESIKFLLQQLKKKYEVEEIPFLFFSCPSFKSQCINSLFVSKMVLTLITGMLSSAPNLGGSSSSILYVNTRTSLALWPRDHSCV